ncbi:substrate-binding periplasmic protein [Sedimenticola hydrogenitrophicus]|uniref:substrate-binding periplasmic protein n=1 Tax=Sedimenticola hydrogenitrophicus TaxID=2967975 RepID=UPI0021A4C60A|nr:transporter substrate-binding domain-containing protein [Sedimenticola hydrogenitrophicus]
MHWAMRLFRTALLLPLLLPATLAAQPLRVLTEELPPLNFTENGEITGLSVELVREIMRRNGQSEAIQSVPWARGYRAALEEPNVVLFSTTRTEEREGQFKWVGPLAPFSYVFYKKRGSPISLSNLDDARQVKSIATYRDDAREQFLKEQHFTNLDSSPKLVSCARKLLEGRVDLWLDSNLTAPQVLKQMGQDPQQIEPVLAVKTNYLYIAFSKQTDDAIVAQWQASLDTMRQDGTFRRIFDKWLPGQEPPPRTAFSAATQSALSRLRILTEELPPVSYYERGNLVGHSAGIVRAIIRRLGINQAIEVMPWSRAYQLALKQPNTALYSTIRSKKRESLFHWVGPIGSSYSQLYARHDFQPVIRTLDDARRVESIGTYRDDADEQFLVERGFTNLYRHSEPEAIARNLMAGRVQLWVGGSLYAPLVMKQAGYPLDRLKPVLTLRKTSFYVAFSRDTPEVVVQLWQNTLDELIEEGLVSPMQAPGIHVPD